MPECQACGKIRHEGALQRVKVWEGEKFSMRYFCAECAQLPHGDLAPPAAPRSSGEKLQSGCAMGFVVLLIAGGLAIAKCSVDTPFPAAPSAVQKQAPVAVEASADDPMTIMSAAEINLKANLKDASSAKLRKLFVSKLDNRAYALCGQVNSKNSFGAYTGFKRFIASVNPDAPTIIEGTPTGYGDQVDAQIFPQAFAKFCGNVVKRFPGWSEL